MYAKLNNRQMSNQRKTNAEVDLVLRQIDYPSTKH